MPLAETGTCCMTANADEIKELTTTLTTLNLTMEKYMAQQEGREALTEERMKHKVDAPFVSDKIEDHEKRLHARNAEVVDTDVQYGKKVNVFLNALGPFLLRYVLPILGVVGAGYGVSTQYNIEPTTAQVVSPSVEKGE